MKCDVNTEANAALGEIVYVEAFIVVYIEDDEVVSAGLEYDLGVSTGTFGNTYSSTVVSADIETDNVVTDKSTMVPFLGVVTPPPSYFPCYS